MDAADAAAMELPIDTAKGSACIGASERQPDVILSSDEDDCRFWLVGRVHEAAHLSARLGLNTATPTITLAKAAFAKFGARTPNEMLGEWSLLVWEKAGTLTLMTSAARRDRLFFAVRGSKVAVSSNLLALTALKWIGRDIDTEGLLFQFGRAAVREQIGNRSMIVGIDLIPAGGSVVIRGTDISRYDADPFLAAGRGNGGFGGNCGIAGRGNGGFGGDCGVAGDGSFEEACAVAERLLLDSVSDRLGGSPAIMLSGGLDSSLLAWAAAQRSGSGRLHLLTSAAPPGTGLPDETAFAATVAQTLGCRCTKVFSDPQFNPFRPPDHILLGANGAVLSNRQSLTDAFQRAGRELGATELVNGTWGELTLTGRVDRTSWLRRTARQFRQRFDPRRGTIGDAFHVRLSAHALNQLPFAVREAVEQSRQPAATGPSRLWGLQPGWQRALELPNEFYPGALRTEYPFRDLRLLRFFAGLPTGFFDRGGFDRAPARAILDGRLPDTIRLRTSGMPAMPDHVLRLRQFAPAARQRIATFRRAQIDEWIDLDWLDGTLARIADHGPRSLDEATQAQITALNAEMLTLWRK